MGIRRGRIQTWRGDSAARSGGSLRKRGAVGNQREDGDRPAPEPGGGGVGSRGDDGLRVDDRARPARRPPEGGGLLPGSPPDDLPGDHPPQRERRPGRRPDRLRGALPARPARRGRWPGRDRQPGRQGPRARKRQALRADRQAELADAAPRGRRQADPAVDRRARRRATGARRERGAAALPGRERGAGRGLPRDRRHPPRRDRQAREARERRLRDHRHRLRLPRPRRQDRRLPARQPDRDRGQAGHGKIDPGLRLRPERRHEASEARRPLLPGDVGDGAGPPLHRLAVSDLQRPAPQGQGREQGLAEGRQGLQPARVRPALDRRLLRSGPTRAAREGAAPARPGAQPRPRAGSG